MSTATVEVSSPWDRFRTALTPREWSGIAGMVGFILLLNVVGWGVLAAFVAPHRYDLGASGVFGIGLGFTAYAFGMRHAFDADHIAAIDNTTRKLMAEGKRPLSVGFWFSLGHSTIVFLLSLLLSLGVRALAAPVENGSSTLHKATGVIGTSVSGVFLYIIGIINLVVLVGIIKVFRRMRQGSFDEVELENQLNNRGFMNRFLNRATRAVRKPRHMYPVGVLFGLGFDTATEVGLLVLAAGAAAFALPWYAILVLPILFAAGMSMFDTADGCFMNFAYGWAFAKPVRKVFYNMTVTALSVAVALIIGTIELVSILTEQLGIDTGPLAAIGNLDLNNVGFAIVGLFVVTWILALAVWRFARIEDRWIAQLKAPPNHRVAPIDSEQDAISSGDQRALPAARPCWGWGVHEITGLREPANWISGRFDDTAERRLANRAVGVSAVGLAVTGLLELVVALITGSVGLLGDALHNLSDVSTSAVVFLGFRISKRTPTERYPYGWERAEDLAGLGVALVIWASAVFAGVESVRKLLANEGTSHVGAGIAAAVLGIVGNQLVAHYKLRVGRRIQSATLVSDAKHSWLDALSSAGALAGLSAVAFGQRWGDPVAGLAVTLFICHVGYEVTRDIGRRLLDGVDAGVLVAAEHAAAVEGVDHIHARARWTGRTLRIEIEGWVDPALAVRDADHLGRHVADAVHAAVPEARVITFIPQATSLPAASVRDAGR